MRAPYTERDKNYRARITEEQKIKLLDSRGLTKDKEADEYLEQLAKFIPGEIVTFYITATTAINSAWLNTITQPPAIYVSWIAFGFAIVATYFFAYTTNKKGLPGYPEKSWRDKALITTVIFIVWVVGIGLPFSTIPGYNPVYGTLIVASFTLIAPKIYDLTEPGK